MSFEKVDLRAARDVDLENAKLAETLAEDLKFNANWCSEALSQAYAEIDRLTAENVDLQSKNAGLYKETGLMMNRIETLESEKDQLAFERNKLAAEKTDIREQLKALEREAADRDKAEPELVWKCSMSLPNGEWRSGDANISNGVINMMFLWARDAYRDWTDPPREGVWRVTEPGKAVWVRE